MRRNRSSASRASLAGEASAAAAEVEASLAIPPDPSAAAFFDVDNTMMMGASVYHFARGLAARKLFTWRDLAGFARQQVTFRVVGKEDPAQMEHVKQLALSFVAGHAVSDVVALGEEVYDDVMASRIWPGTRALAQLHLDSGQRVWLVTAAPVELAALIARRLGLTGALGTVGESVGGVYTGRLVGEPLHGPAKAEAVRALARREGLDLARCSAYSDSINDLPMLTTVGNPVAVNPDPQLRRVARERGWPVRDFRTGRKAARVGLPALAGAGGITVGVAVGLAVRRRRPEPPPAGLGRVNLDVARLARVGAGVATAARVGAGVARLAGLGGQARRVAAPAPSGRRELSGGNPRRY